MNNTSTRSYKINVKNPVYCIVTEDTASGTTYGPVKSLGESQQAQITAQASTGKLYGNGTVVDSSAKLTGLTLALTSTKVPVEAKAEIYNYTVTNGVVQVKAGVQANYIAVGYEVEQTGGKSEYVWLLKGRPQPISEDVAQSEANITYSTESMTIEFVERVSDGNLQFFADGANDDFTDAQAAKWFTTGPATIPTV